MNKIFILFYTMVSLRDPWKEVSIHFIRVGACLTELLMVLMANSFLLKSDSSIQVLKCFLDVINTLTIYWWGWDPFNKFEFVKVEVFSRKKHKTILVKLLVFTRVAASEKLKKKKIRHSLSQRRMGVQTPLPSPPPPNCKVFHLSFCSFLYNGVC